MRPLFFALFLLLFHHSLAAQTALSQRLRHALDSTFSEHPSRNVSAALVTPNGAIWTGTRGKNSFLPNDTLTPNDLIGMGSITKTFTATLLLQLQEDSLIDLDDSIGLYLPPLTHVNGHITVRQMLNHTSGLNDYLNENPAFVDSVLADPARIWTPLEIAQHYILAPNFSAGAGWSYSNTNFLLAQLVIEAVTGQPFAEVLRTRILTPQQLDKIFLYPDESLPPSMPLAHLWSDITGDGISDDLQSLGFPLEGLFSSAGGAGALVSTPSNLATFMHRLLNGQVLEPASLSEMQQTVFPPAPYRLGIFPAQIMGKEAWGHDGNIVYQSLCFHFPNENFTLAVQTSDGDDTLTLPSVFLSLVNAYCQYALTDTDERPSTADTPALYPNPTTHSVRLNLPEGQTADLQLFDAAGRLLLQQQAQNGTEIGISNFPSGLYFWKTRMENGREQSGKIQKN